MSKKYNLLLIQITKIATKLKEIKPFRCPRLWISCPVANVVSHYDDCVNYLDANSIIIYTKKSKIIKFTCGMPPASEKIYTLIWSYSDTSIAISFCAHLTLANWNCASLLVHHLFRSIKSFWSILRMWWRQQPCPADHRDI